MKKIIFFTLLTQMIGVSPFICQEHKKNQKDQWDFLVAPYVWFGTISNTAGVGIPGSPDFNVSLEDILKSIKFGIMLQAEVQKGHWGGMFDLINIKFGADKTIRIGEVEDFILRFWIIDGMIDYRFNQSWGSIDAYTGIRYWNIDMNLTLYSVYEVYSGDRSSVHAYVDPVIGLRVIYDISNKWFCIFKADVGGFVAGSKISYMIQPAVGFHFSNLFAMSLKLRYLTTDYESGQAGTPEYFLLDAVIKGPLLSFIFKF